MDAHVLKLLPCDQNRRKLKHSKTRFQSQCYLVHVEQAAVVVEMGVEGVEHVDDLHGCGCGADGCEPNKITEQHGDVIDLHRFHTFT